MVQIMKGRRCSSQGVKGSIWDWMVVRSGERLGQLKGFMVQVRGTEVQPTGKETNENVAAPRI